jgi:hypothetical protein
MCLLMQNMKSDIPSNGGERISDCIMCSPPGAQRNRCILVKFMVLVAYASRKTTSRGMGRSNLVRNVEEKMFKVILEDGMIK